MLSIYTNVGVAILNILLFDLDRHLHSPFSKVVALKANVAISCEAIGKQIQLKWKEDLGEDKYVMMLGALHIEFVIGAVEGKLTDGSEFSYIISEAGVLTSGR